MTNLEVKLAEALMMVLNSSLVSNDKHEPTTCTQYSCKKAMEALSMYHAKSDFE